MTIVTSLWDCPRYVIISAMASQITGVSIVYSTVCSGADQRNTKAHVTGLWEGNTPVTDESHPPSPSPPPSNHRRLDCLLYRLFRRRSKKRPKFHVTGLCEGNTLVTIVTSLWYCPRYFIMSAMASQITGVSIVYSTVCSGADQRNTEAHVTGLCERNTPVTDESPPPPPPPHTHTIDVSATYLGSNTHSIYQPHTWEETLLCNWLSPCPE